MMNQQQATKLARKTGDYANIWQNTGKCVFCDLKQKYIIAEENDIALTINLYPYIDGHLMAIPKKHIASPKELTAAQWDTIRKFSYLAKKMLRKIYGYKSMWTLIREGGTKAQMTVTEHLHVQFIPFDEADLCAWNYRDIKYTAEENAQKYQDQAAYMKKLAKRFSEKYGKKD